MMNKSIYLALAVFLIFFNTSFKSTVEQKVVYSIIRENGPHKPIDDDAEIVRKRIIDDLLAPLVNIANVSQLVQTIRLDGSWPGIDYADTSKTGFEHRIHLENMLELARAFRKNGSEFTNNIKVKKTLSMAFDFWTAHNFICENWWWNEMGTPNLIINTLLIMDNDLTEQQRTAGAKIASRASLTGFGARAGGDFVPIAGMVCKQALFKRDDAMLSNALNVMGEQVVVTPARGINPDLGFHHRLDNVTSIHTYGTNYVSSFAYWAVKTAGTKFALSPKALHLLIDYYVDGVSKAMAYGLYPDPGARNRDLSRITDSHETGTEILKNLLLTSDYRKKDLEYLVRIRRGDLKPMLSWNKYFWHSSYYAHQSINFYTSVRMHSSRQNNMEEPYNEEGLKNHHVADGANFISRTGKEYAGVYPVWDWQKIPGTTVVQKPSLPPFNQVAKKGKSDFVGAVSDGRYGAAAFDFKSVHDPLTARKSWFFFDKEYVCLGAGITSESPFPVASTINQTSLNKTVFVNAASNSKTLGKGKHELKGVTMVLHDSIAYLFPTPTSVNISNTNATGSWREINHQASVSNEMVSKDLFSLWLNHGHKPAGATYAYMVVPAISQRTATGYVEKSGVNILSNTTAIQAVQNNLLGITEAVFYQPGSININKNLVITAHNPCIILLQVGKTGIQKIAVAEPTHKLASLQLSINKPIHSSSSKWQSMWDEKTKASTLTVSLPAKDYAGQSVVLQF